VPAESDPVELEKKIEIPVPGKRFNKCVLDATFVSSRYAGKDGRHVSRRVLAKGCLQALAISVVICATASSSRSGVARICVIAVNDSGLFTMCPSPNLIKEWKYPTRTQNLEIVRNPYGPRLAVPQHLIQIDRPVLDRSRGGWWNQIGKTPGLSPSGRIDSDLKKGIEIEFSKRDDYRLVDSAAQADLVFLAEGFDADQNSGFIGAQPGRYRSTGRPMLALVMAIVIPADVYLRDPAESEALLAGKIWEGSEAWKSNPPEIDRQPASAPVSLERLVGQFADHRDQKSSFPSLCAPGILAPSVDGQGMPRSKPEQKDGNAGLPVSSRNVAKASVSDPIVKLSVSLVTVPTVVSDTDDRNVPDLSTIDFHLFENGIEQTIDRVVPEVAPFNVVLMLDTSGSTILHHSEIQDAALLFVEALRPEDRIMVISFDSYIYLDSVFTRDRAALRRAILHTDTGAGTRLYDALDLVLTECLDRIVGRKAIVLFTDGADTQSWLAPLGEYHEKVEESDALVYGVQFKTASAAPASRYLKGLSENSGGRLFIASSTSNLSATFAGIADELLHQYTICYYPSNQGVDSSFRRIRVTVDRPGTKVRARTGYRIASQSAGY